MMIVYYFHLSSSSSQNSSTKHDGDSISSPSLLSTTTQPYDLVDGGVQIRELEDLIFQHNLPFDNRDSAVLTQDLCKRIKQGELAPVEEFFTQFENNNAADDKLLRGVLQNSDLTDYRATPVITSYIIASEKTKNLEVFNIVFNKVVEMWKDDSTMFQMEIVQRRAQQYFFEGSDDGRSTPIFFNATLLNLICRNSDETSLKRVIDASIGVYSGRNDRVLDMIFTGMCASTVQNVFIYATPSFIDQFFAQTVDRLTIDSDERRQNCMKYIFERSSSFSSICQRATSVENLNILFDKVRAIGGQDLLLHRFKSTINRSSTLMTSVVSHQTSIAVIKFLFETLEKLELLEDHFRCERDDNGRDVSVLARMCEHQTSLEIVKYIFEMIDSNNNFDKEYWKENFRGGRYPLYKQCLHHCLLTSSDSKLDVLKFLLDSVVALDSTRFQTEWNPRNLFRFLVSSASGNSFAGVMMILAHFSNEKTCNELVQFRDDHGRTAAAMTSSPKIQQLLKKPNPWEFSVTSYWKRFDGALPPVAPWKNDDTFSWLKNIVDEIDGLEMNSAEVLNLIFGLSENEITSPEGLGAAEQTKIDEILSAVKNDTLRAEIKDLGEAEHKKQHQPALPFITELFTKLAVTPLDGDSIGILVKNKIKNVEDFMDLSIDDLKEMSFPIGERKRIQEVQKKNASFSELYRRIADHFSPNYIFMWSEVEVGKVLGSGGGGEVFRATLTNTKRPVAAKRFINVTDDKAIEECRIAMNLHHKNIVSFVGISIFTATVPNWREEIYAFFELGKGTLSDKLSSSSCLPWTEVLRYSFEIASGLNYLHNAAECNKSNLHLDLKPPNILLDEHDHVKLCDFGLSRAKSIDVSHATVSHAGFGTLRWMSPEQLSSTQMRPTNDVYSFGCILYNMIDEQGRQPWYDLRSGDLRNLLISEANMTASLLVKKISSEHRGDCPEFLLDLCKSCLNSDYKMRPIDGGELVELLKSGILDLCEDDAWKQHLGNVSYLQVHDGAQAASNPSHTVCEDFNSSS